MKTENRPLSSDAETKLYYLQSRYYDPLVKRFVNADGYASTGQGFQGYNMYCYCLNSPVCLGDALGSDAFYVADTGEDGLPVVGHAFLYIQNEDGAWYKTEYSGDIPDKSTAIVKLYPADMHEVEKMISGSNIEGLMYEYFEGDSTPAYERATELKGTNYGGYNLFTNNCTHYAREILSYVNTSGAYLRHAIASSRNIVPVQYGNQLNAAKAINSFVRRNIVAPSSIKKPRSVQRGGGRNINVAATF